MDRVIIHYAEIGIKGKNRPYFEKLLANNIKTKIGILPKKESGQLTISLTGSEDLKIIESKLKEIPGIAYFSFAKNCGYDIEELKNNILTLIKDLKFNNFKIDTKRHDKQYPKTSIEVNQIIGEAVHTTYNKPGKMDNPDLKIKIEITKNIYVSLNDIRGIGGLPSESKNKVVVLLSGGFDSPVAAFMMMKRGVNAILIHFQNEGQLSSSVKDKVKRIAERLSSYQQKTKFYIIPFESIQKEIIKNVKAETRMLIYRIFMLKIAEKIALEEKASFLVVGDSLSQVASQTMENLKSTYEQINMHILSPLIGLDKEEIIKISQNIQTYELSALPYGDCCSFFLPKHPELRSTSENLSLELSKFDIEKIINEVLEKKELYTF